jgi:hypothetical protein
LGAPTKIIIFCLKKKFILVYLMNIKLKNNAHKEIRLNNQSVAFEEKITKLKIHFFVKQTKK